MEQLKSYILSLGADLAGFASLSALSGAGRQNMPCGVAFGIGLDPRIVAGIGDMATLEYADLYNTVNDRLDFICEQVGNYITQRGFRAVAQTVRHSKHERKATAHLPSAGRALVPHKTVAALAGLGWIGKSSLLITPRFGSAVRLSSVLTDAPVDALSASYSCLCGSCSACSDVCPGSAIRGRTWQPGCDRDDLISHEDCRRTVCERGRAIGREYGACGLCVAVCPHTRTYLRQELSV